MCGVVAVLEPDGGLATAELAARAERMASCVAHRGPDDAGVWIDERVGIALGHRRLAILDTSEAGHQPMSSASGRWVITYNGEIYNHLDLRTPLERAGIRFRGSSDTETLIEAIDAWGLRETLERLNGMFAFAAWDRAERRLHLARDRVGEKPLYYGRVGGALVLASELKALRAYPGFRSAIDPRAIGLLLRYGYIPAPYSIYDGIAKLPAATSLTVDDRGVAGDPVPYWSLVQTAKEARETPFTGDAAEAEEELDRLIRSSVGARMISDVPLGAFLSGGIDSSMVVSAMQARSTTPIRTFTVGFGDREYDEAPQARAVAEHLGTDHTEVHVPEDRALEVVERLPDLYDEPFADPSALPTTLISEVARRHVTVCLSGDGGDEMFGGYNRYTFGPSVWRASRRFPRPLRAGVARALLAPSYDWMSKTLGGTSLGGRMPRMPAMKAQKLAGVLRAEREEDLREVLVGRWEDPNALMTSGNGAGASIGEDPGRFLDTATERMMLRDCVSELPDDMLVKVDRASMSHGLETRLPLLDPDVIAFAWRLPLAMRVRGTEGKWLLRRVLYRYVPRELVERPKMGFDPPLGAWLRTRLRGWAEDLLTPSRLTANGLRAEPIRARWDEHLRGRRNWDYALWTVLVLQSWTERQSAIVVA